MRSNRSSSRLNLSSHAKVRSTRILNAWMASLKKRVRPRLVVLRLRGFSGMLGMRPALKIAGFDHRVGHIGPRRLPATSSNVFAQRHACHPEVVYCGIVFRDMHGRKHASRGPVRPLVASRASLGPWRRPPPMATLTIDLPE